MSNLALLISHGFRNPGPEESQQILASFHANATFNNREALQEWEAHGTFGDDDDMDMSWVSMGRTGRVFRFIQLETYQIARTYNNPDNPHGLRAVLRLQPATCFTNRGPQMADILYTSDGYIVLCVATFAHFGNLTAGEFVDPANGRETPRNKPPQHVPRPPNAFILYRLSKVKEVKQRFPDMTNNDISKVVGKLWHDETNEVKNTFKLLARKQTTEFLLENPNYKYQPRKASEIIRRPGGLRRFRNPNHGKQNVRKA